MPVKNDDESLDVALVDPQKYNELERKVLKELGSNARKTQFSYSKYETSEACRHDVNSQ
jgi:hypothetical protein